VEAASGGRARGCGVQLWGGVHLPAL